MIKDFPEVDFADSNFFEALEKKTSRYESLW
jgi:hypothetical protein